MSLNGSDSPFQPEQLTLTVFSRPVQVLKDLINDALKFDMDEETADKLNIFVQVCIYARV